jgi:hypothetical protein
VLRKRVVDTARFAVGAHAPWPHRGRCEEQPQELVDGRITGFKVHTILGNTRMSPMAGVVLYDSDRLCSTCDLGSQDKYSVRAVATSLLRVFPD